MNETYEVFFNRLNQLNPGDRAALRRSAGKMLPEAEGRALTVFYRCLPPGVPAYQEDRWFAVACLRCLWDTGEEGAQTLPQIIRSLTESDKLSESAAHRVEALMDTPWDSDGYMLSKLYRLVVLVRQKAERATPDFSGLLDDLMAWNRDDQRIQKNWAREIFSYIN